MKRKRLQRRSMFSEEVLREGNAPTRAGCPVVVTISIIVDLDDCQGLKMRHFLTQPLTDQFNLFFVCLDIQGFGPGNPGGIIVRNPHIADVEA